MRSLRSLLLLTRCSTSLRFIVCSCSLLAGATPRERSDSVELVAEEIEIVARSPAVVVVVSLWYYRVQIYELAFDRVPLVVPGDAVLPDQLEPHLVQVLVPLLPVLLGAGEIGPGTRVGRQACEGPLDLKALFVGEQREAFEPSRRAAAGRGVESGGVPWIWSHSPRRLSPGSSMARAVDRGRGSEDAPRRATRHSRPESLSSLYTVACDCTCTSCSPLLLYTRPRAWLIR